MPDLAPALPTLSARDRLLRLEDHSHTPKWRLFDGPADVKPGTSSTAPAGLVWSVTPGEWTLLGDRPETDPIVDLSHVRGLFRLTGPEATRVMEKVCALDFGDHMFPDGAAARTTFAGVATEIVRHHQDGAPSYLLLPSRSFARFLHDVIADAGHEFGWVVL